VTWTRGRLILWSNDVLLALAGDGFAHTQHVSKFLWMAKDLGISEAMSADIPADD
jgi:hypothetical protein